MIRIGWDNPLVTIKADDKRRVVLPTAKPGDVYQVDYSAGRITLTKLVPAEPKLVKSRKVNGRWMGAAEARPDRQSIVDAIRADRESR